MAILGLSLRERRVHDTATDRPESNQMPERVSLGEPTLFSGDNSEIFSRARIQRYSHELLSAEAWFRSAGELIAAMELLEPEVNRFWAELRSVTFAADMTSDAPIMHRKSERGSKS